MIKYRDARDVEDIVYTFDFDKQLNKFCVTWVDKNGHGKDHCVNSVNIGHALRDGTLVLV